MRILTLLAGANSVPEVVALTGEIRNFNAEIDFRLRFLHVEIEEVYAATESTRPELESRIERAQVLEIADGPQLEVAARLALLLNRERPDVLMVAGEGELLGPAVAAARAHGTKLAYFGAGRGSSEDGLDLGEAPRVAVERLTGVAREIR